jgi:hypothetical protein
MTYFIKAILASLLAAIALYGCENSASQAVVDNNMNISRQNAQKSADAFVGTLYPGGSEDAKLGKPIRALMDSDSSIKPECRHGDGWASGNILFEKGQKLPIICQTNGTGKGNGGCLTKKDFEEKSYKNENNICQGLPELEKFK